MWQCIWKHFINFITLCVIQTMVIFVFDKNYFNGESQNFVKRENCPVNSFISALCFSSILQENKF